MPDKFVLLIIKNIMRSKIRAFITVFGSIMGAFIISFFITAEYSLDRLVYKVGGESNLIITQRGRY